MAHELPQLPYAYDALEPYIDAQTMEIHHSKHHQGYVNKLNTALESFAELQSLSIEELLKQLPNLDIDPAAKTAIQNNGGGHANHTLFWSLMGSQKEVNESLVQEIESTFNGMENFKEQFSDAATKRFGSGWAWLVRNGDGKLEVYSTANQDSPLLQGHEPIICLDVWEHAYYLKYQNKRPDYIENWWDVLKVL